jgi:hypothetical protein
MRKIDRLSKYMEFKGLNDNVVTKECSLSQGLIGQARKGKCDLGDKAIDKILNTYLDLDRVWLLTGEGEMIKQDKPKHPMVARTEALIDKLIASMEETIESQKKVIEAQKEEIERLQRALQERERGM